MEHQLFSWIESHSSDFSGVMIDWTCALYIFFFMAIFFTIKFFKNIKLEEEKAKELDVWNELVSYHIERCSFGFAISVLVSYISIIITGNAINIILNYFVIPIFSVVVSLYVDGIFKNNGWIGSKFPDLSARRKGDNESPHQPISIVINNDLDKDDEDNLEYQPDFFHEFPEVSEDKIQEKGSAWYLNILGRNQHILNKRLEKNEEEMLKQSKTLEALRQDRIGEKAIEIEKLIYSALEKQFATPEEDKLIRKKYRLYHEVLLGNSDIAELYNERYLKIPVHEDRRKQNIPVEHDRRK